MSPEAIAEELALRWDPDADRHDPDVWSWWCDACGAWVTDPGTHAHWMEEAS